MLMRHASVMLIFMRILILMLILMLMRHASVMLIPVILIQNGWLGLEQRVRSPRASFRSRLV
jgi:hypothetical protein